MSKVYLICDIENNNYKIGVTKGDIYKRIKKLQTGNCTNLFLIYAHNTEYPFTLEKMLHCRFNPDRTLNEWFALSDEDVINFPKTCNEMENTIKVMKDNPHFKKRLN